MSKVEGGCDGVLVHNKKRMRIVGLIVYVLKRNEKQNQNQNAKRKRIDD